ncbi:MAG: sigma-54-dependent transcriptional regulator [Polyangiales bacterium]
MARVLLCDDDAGVLFTLEEVLGSKGHATVSARSGEEALKKLAGVDVVVTDLAMPGMDGLALLAEIRKRDPELPVILLTARGSERIAVAAMKAGAHDYLAKPFANDEIGIVVERAAETRALRHRSRDLSIERAIGGRIVGEDPAFLAVLADAKKLATRDVPVLVRGETGTGKELFATLLHAGSPRADQPLVRFNCAAIAPELAESELFGHVRGAFTGATASRRGFFQEADGGTLVLDEVGELPASMQPKLLRALQSGEVQQVGSSKIDRVDVRVIACTHRDLRASGFREDLYYRLAVVELMVPSLRERRSDIPLLVEEFRRRWARRFGIDDARFTEGLIFELSARSWPGNVRELENAVGRILALSSGGTIDVDALSRLSSTPTHDPDAGLRDQMAAFERSILERVLGACQWNQSEAARRLGITRVTLIDKMKRHGLRKP